MIETKEPNNHVKKNLKEMAYNFSETHKNRFTQEKLTQKKMTYD